MVKRILSMGLRFGGCRYFDYVILEEGLAGLTAAYFLSKQHPDQTLCLLEKRAVETRETIITIWEA